MSKLLTVWDFPSFVSYIRLFIPELRSTEKVVIELTFVMSPDYLRQLALDILI